MLSRTLMSVKLYVNPIAYRRFCVNPCGLGLLLSTFASSEDAERAIKPVTKLPKVAPHVNALYPAVTTVKPRGKPGARVCAFTIVHEQNVARFEAASAGHVGLSADVLNRLKHAVGLLCTSPHAAAEINTQFGVSLWAGNK